MTKLLLVRHGETWANREKIFAGNYDVALTELGEEQAKATAQYVKENYDVDIVYASDLQRAYNTGKIISETLAVDMIVEEGVREINGGDWERKPFTELIELYPEEYGVWLKNIGKSVCVGGESVEQQRERVMPAFEKIAKENEGKTVLVATHATPIRIAQTLTKYGNLDYMQDVPWVSNASVSEFEYENGTWTCVRASIDEHLGEMKTMLPKEA